MRCPKCGQELAEDVKFCKRCGTPVAAGSQPGLPETSDGLTAALREPGKKKKGHPVLLVFLILVLFAAGAGGAVLGVKIWRARKDESQTQTASQSVKKNKSRKSEKEEPEDEGDTQQGDSSKEKRRDDKGSEEPAADRSGEDRKAEEPASAASEESAADRSGEDRKEEEPASAASGEPVTGTSKEDGKAGETKEDTSGKDAETLELAAEGNEAGGKDPKEGTAAASESSESRREAVPVTMDHVELVMASSSLSEYNMTHSPKRLYDGDLSSAWVEGAEGQGIGESVTFCFDQTCRLTGFLIYGGYQKSTDLYQKNSRPAKLRVFIPGYEETIYLLGDEFGAQEIPLEFPVEADEITFTIEEVYPGSKYEDTVISELTFY